MPHARARRTIHPVWVRVTHWINALAMLFMIGSGWKIYNASPLFRLSSRVALGDWLAGALLGHFAAMWLLAINGVVYLTLGIATGRFRRKLFPIRPARGRRAISRRRCAASSRTTISRSTTRCRGCFISA